MTTHIFKPASNAIGRDWQILPNTVVVHRTLASCEVINITDRAGCSLLLPTGVTGLIFHSMKSESDASPKVIRVATSIASGLIDDQWVDFPPECFSHGFVKAQSVGADGDACVCGKT